MALERVGAHVNGTAVKCPFHEDASPSGEIIEDPKTGIWRYRCHAIACGFDWGNAHDVLRYGGLPVEDDGTQTKTQKTYPNVEAIAASFHTLQAAYLYRDATTSKEKMLVVRYLEPNGKKRFSQFHLRGSEWVAGAPERPWPLYNTQVALSSNRCVIVEGEKCVEALRGIGIPAVSAPCGAGKAEHTDWSPLSNMRRVVLWPDNDEPGSKHMDQVADLIEGPETLRIEPTVAWPECPAKGDVADFIESIRSQGTEDPEQIRKIVLEAIKTARPIEDRASVRLLGRYSDIASGKHRTIDWPWPHLSDLTGALAPGTISLLCGSPGSGKTLLLTQAITAWVVAGERVAVYELEEGKEFFVSRVLAQEAHDHNLVEEKWIRANFHVAKSILHSHEGTLDAVGQSVTAPSAASIKLEEIVAWAERKAKTGIDIIAVDPITAAAATEKPWESDQVFVLDMLRIAREYNTRVVLVTHPRKETKQTPDLSALAGGAAMSRFVQTVIWIEFLSEDEDVIAKVSAPMQEDVFMPVTQNRVLHLKKTRRGPGQGKKIAYWFAWNSLRFEERGILQKLKRRRIGEGVRPIEPDQYTTSSRFDENALPYKD